MDRRRRGQPSLWETAPGPERSSAPADADGGLTDPAAAVARADGWEEVRRLAEVCHGCELWRNATQTVFGEGPVPARAMLVGEQPGDREDRQGRPFVGPAGRVLDDALEEIGVDRTGVYVTNVVKHFKWTPSGSVRIHKTPSAREVKACAPWFQAEVSAVRPELLVCLGATAAKFLLGPQFRLTQERGRFVEAPWARRVLATVHPSSILRTREDRAVAMEDFVDDLRAAFAALSG
jgi:DNA polymerase